MMKNTFRPGLVCIFLTVCAVGACVRPALAGSKIIAIVNRDTITEKEINDFIGFMRIQLAKEMGGEAAEKKVDAMKNDLLNKLVDDRLILQEAKKAKIEVDPNRVKARLADIRNKYRSDQAFQEDLLRQGLSQADIENKIKEQMMTFMIIEREVRSKITIRPEDVTEFYNKNKDKFLSPGIRELDEFIFENKNYASLFSYNLRIGKKVEDLASRYPFVFEQVKASTKDELKKEIGDVVFKLGIREVSESVTIDDKYYVFRLTNIVLPKQLSLSEAQDSIYAYLFDQKMQEEVARWLKDLKKQSYIKILKI